MALDKLKKTIFGGDSDSDIGEEITETTETSVEEDYYSKSRQSYQQDNGVAGSKMILLEPRAYSESQQIADYLKSRNAVVVNLKRVTPDQAKRIVDFLSGTLYAIGGDLQNLGGGIFLCTPNNVDVEGHISDDREPAKGSRKNNAKEKEEQIDEYDW